MKALTTTLLSLAAASMIEVAAFADDKCTKEPRSKWMKETDARAKIEAMGYKVERFTIEDGCYEVEGRNKGGRKVDAKFNPVDLRLVDEEEQD